MKWFLAVNENANGFDSYAQMLQVAITTGQRHTTLEPHVLYDGDDNWLTEWLNAKGAIIWKVRSRFFEQLQRLAEERGKPRLLRGGAGALLRTEIPVWAAERGLTERFVLYTDVDVMFVGPVEDELRRHAPRYFAVAPQFHPNDWLDMNTGVMLMNVPQLTRDAPRFLALIVEMLDRGGGAGVDQDAYRLFYRPRVPKIAQRILLRVGRLGPFLRWQKLPPEMNWKPYWGPNEAARIIHFHGIKPNDFQQSSLPPRAKRFGHLATPHYKELCEVWRDEMAKV